MARITANDVIKIYRGDTWSKKINVVNADLTPFDLTGFGWTMTIRNGTTELLKVTGNCNTAPTTGIEAINLSSENTDIDIGVYKYDIQIANEAVPPIVKTCACGILHILRDESY